MGIINTSPQNSGRGGGDEIGKKNHVGAVHFVGSSSASHNRKVGFQPNQIRLGLRALLLGRRSKRRRIIIQQSPEQ